MESVQKCMLLWHEWMLSSNLAQLLHPMRVPSNARAIKVQMRLLLHTMRILMTPSSLRLRSWDKRSKGSSLQLKGSPTSQVWHVEHVVRARVVVACSLQKSRIRTTSVRSQMMTLRMQLAQGLQAQAFLRPSTPRQAWRKWWPRAKRVRRGRRLVPTRALRTCVVHASATAPGVFLLRAEGGYGANF